MNIEAAAQWTGLVIGAVMLVIICIVHVRRERFGLGGAMLTVFGALLVGMSIWESAKFSFSPDGGFGAEVTRLQEQVEALSGEVSSVQAETRALADTNLRLERELVETRETLIEAPNLHIDPARERAWRRSHELRRRALEPGDG